MSHCYEEYSRQTTIERFKWIYFHRTTVDTKVDTKECLKYTLYCLCFNDCASATYKLNFDPTKKHIEKIALATNLSHSTHSEHISVEDQQT